ncbi:MAG: hypothetical protein LBU66_04995, partial [Treponema sp.]|nr:hypothetical protein [Treponema sp.]
MFNQKLKTQRIAIFGAVLLALITLSVVLTTCEGMSSMGFGDPIDFEAPVLKLDRYPNPYYVKSTMTISGTATDNVAVDKVVCRYLDTDINEYRILGTATISGDRFSITINFTDDDNNRKISAEVVAWDKMGNSDEGSIDFITFIVDTSPPVFKEPYIQRALSRSAPLRDFNDLTGLNHRNIQHTDLIQNGSFWIKAEVIEDETMAKSIQLFLFDADNDEDGKQIYAEEFENKNNPFSPEWTIHEHNIIERGNAKGYDYSGKVARGEPIYLRVSMVAYDLANNHGEWDKKQEDFGWFVIDRRADVPKALLAGGIADIIPPGTEIPLDVFDDDTIDEVYIDLIKIEQWFGIQGADDAAKWETLRQKFASGEEVLNWDNQPITNRRTMAAPPESMTVSVKTGTTTAACGEYMLVGFVKDKKGAPHEPPHDTPVWGELTHKITIADQNSALIVIDTVVCENGNCGNPLHLGHDTRTGASTGNSPEESTFPKLGDGRYFTISGYTLNESSDQQAGYVSEFKIAWIPYAIIDAQGVATSVDAVKAAMENKASYPEGVQHWSFDRQIGSPPAGANSYFIDGSSQDIAGVNYTKQTFKKQFDILGGNDDIHGVGGSGANRGYKYFTYNDGNNDKFENEDKYFVLYAKNNNGNITYRTIRLLGNKNPPALKVYDFTNVIELDGITDTNPTHHYTTIRNFARDVSGNIKPEMENYVAKPFTAYPIGKVYKLYIVADADHGVEITGLDMFDSTDGTKIRVGNINTANNDITFVMKLDENELKVFNFEAGNALDVHASAMRTLAVTNTAQLVDITTALADGEYGRNDTITLRAEFSSPVMVWSSSAARPHLNIRYETKGRNSGITDPTSWAYASIPYTGELNDSSGAVQFQFQVPANANGRLQTLHLGNSNGTTFSGDRPINLSGARIVDSLREEDVFLPGNGETGYPLVWNTDERSLQHTKNILLDGIAPYVTTIIIHNGEAGDDEGEKDDYLLDRGKPPPFTGGTAYSKWYYYNREDTVYLEIIANKTIRTVGLPRLQFQTRNPNGNLQATLRYADYVRPTDRGLLFAVSAASIPDNGNGIIVQLTLPNDPVNRITDLVGNTMVNNPTGQTSFTNLFINMNVALVIDTVVPAGVLPRLDVDAQNNPLEVPHPEAFYSKNPVLKFANSNGTSAVTTDFISTGTENWGTFMEYSLDGGTSWYVLNQTVTNDDRRPVGATAVGGELALSSGEYDLVTRQRDKAGNISVESLVYKVQVEADFPNLIGINVRQPRG